MSERRIELAPQVQHAFRAGRDASGLFIHVKDAKATNFEVTHPDGGHAIAAIPSEREPGPWMAYTFWLSSAELEFTLAAGTAIHADVLVVGGGGSGGGGYQGGGGSGGEMVDQHHYAIRAGYNDGLVVVGAGGDYVDPTATEGNVGDPSSFGRLIAGAFRGLIAQGGGYGGAEQYTKDPESGELTFYCNYQASDGPSGGGGSAWDANGDPHGPGGKATPVQGYGHDGGPGSARQGPTSWEDIVGGGAGGASHAGGYQGDVYRYDQGGYISGNYPSNGGHGRPCDIAGWPLYVETAGVLKYIPWFAGGGEGCIRNGLTGQHSVPGCGGGGAAGSAGTQNTGGGGGGASAYGAGEYTGASGPAGGRGVVIIRIKKSDFDLVTSPLPNYLMPDPDYIVAEQSAPEAAADLTIAHQPDYPRNITITADAAQFEVCTITGTGVDFGTLTEDITFDGAKTVAGSEIFRTVTSVHVATPTGPAHISVGIGDQFTEGALLYPSGVIVTEIPADQPHIDQPGDEAHPVTYEEAEEME